MSKIRLSGASITKVKAEIDRYFATHATQVLEVTEHECGSQCSDTCKRETDIKGATAVLQHPTQMLVEDFVERILEAL